MKTTLRLPTKDPFAFIEVELEGDLQPEEIVERYGSLHGAYWNRTKAGTGLDKKTFDAMLDDYIWNGGSWKEEQFSKLNEEQQTIVQAIKRSKNRVQGRVRREDMKEVDRIKGLSQE
ncbi:MAG TPA: hypothetical protein VIY48_16300 [Candidatus Paceibacterota bacterium]